MNVCKPQGVGYVCEGAEKAAFYGHGHILKWILDQDRRVGEVGEDRPTV